MYKFCLECHKREEECKCKEPILETVFEHVPQGIPPLDEEQHKALIKEMNKSPTKKQIEHLKKCRKQFDDIDRRSRNGKLAEHCGEIIDTGDGHKWMYDSKYTEWIDVEPSPILKKLLDEGKFVRLR